MVILESDFLRYKMESDFDRKIQVQTNQSRGRRTNPTGSRQFEEPLMRGLLKAIHNFQKQTHHLKIWFNMRSFDFNSISKIRISLR